MVNFLRKGLRINIDDMACMYSQEGGFSDDTTCGLVLKESVNGSTNRSYSAHREEGESPSKRFKGTKGRFTNLLSDSGHMGAIWLQFPGLTAEQMPPDKVPEGVIVLKVEGLTVVSTTHFVRIIVLPKFYLTILESCYVYIMFTI